MSTNEEIKKDLSKLLKTFNSKRVISEEEIKDVLTAIVGILAENKKSVEALNTETKSVVKELLGAIDVKSQERIKEILATAAKEHGLYVGKLKENSTVTTARLEKALKAQHDRAFKSLQKFVNNIKLPRDGRDGTPGKDGLPGRDGSPDTPLQIVEKLETLEGEERLDAKAVKNLPQLMEKVEKMPIGGARFLEQLADVAVLIATKRQGLLIQYDETNHRWQGGVALTVSVTPPSNPQVNDIWVDLN